MTSDSSAEDDEQGPGPAWLQRRAASLRANGAEHASFITARNLLRKFGYNRRRPEAIARIRSATRAAGLELVPDLAEVPLDGRVDLRLLEARSPVLLADREATEDRPRSLDDPDSAAILVGQLPTARTKDLQTVHRDNPATKAFAIMTGRGYFQVPVLENPRKAVGLISWQTVGQAIACGLKDPASMKVADLMTPTVEICRTSDRLLDVISRVIAAECVLVRDEVNVITGIITTADLATVLRDQFHGFGMLGEIENLLRILLDHVFRPEELAQARDGRDDTREVRSAADLSFGEYKTLLSDEARWSRLGLHLDRAKVLDRMETVRKIRNALMHFSVDRLPPEDEAVLAEFLRFVRTIVGELRRRGRLTA